MFIRKTRIKLNNSFPVNTVAGEAINCNVNDVPLSSSLTKARESPDIAEIFSFPIENSITLIATIINIASELIA